MDSFGMNFKSNVSEQFCIDVFMFRKIMLRSENCKCTILIIENFIFPSKIM